MDFGLSEEQRLLQDTIRKLLGAEFQPARARAVSQLATAHDADLWAKLAVFAASS